MTELLLQNQRELTALGAIMLGFALLFLLLRLLRPKERYPFERRDLLTKNEQAFYEILSRVSSELHLTVFVKLRLADVLAVTGDTPGYMSYFNKIKAKHTDFILCDPSTLEVILGVELDDVSHLRKERRERDDFVDRAYAAAGISLLHVWMPITEEELRVKILNACAAGEGFGRRS